MSLLGGRPVLALEGDTHLNALLDTGSSAFSLICGPAVFEALTDGTSQVWTVRTTGGEGLVDIRAANCTVCLRAGSVRIPISTVYGTGLVDQLASASGGQANAIIGNEAFRGRLVVFDLRKPAFIVSEP